MALEGAARYPDHAELTKAARVLAPPTVTRAPHPHTANIPANRAWLKASAVFPRLPELLRRLRDLEARLRQLEGHPPADQSD